jgi:hypothetical protein
MRISFTGDLFESMRDILNPIDVPERKTNPSFYARDVTCESNHQLDY